LIRIKVSLGSRTSTVILTLDKKILIKVLNQLRSRAWIQERWAEWSLPSKLLGIWNLTIIRTTWVAPGITTYKVSPRKIICSSLSNQWLMDNITHTAMESSKTSRGTIRSNRWSMLASNKTMGRLKCNPLLREVQIIFQLISYSNWWKTLKSLSFLKSK